MKLADLDTSVFFFDPSDNKALQRLSEYHEDFDFPVHSGIKMLKNVILRFIILQYDKNSPLRHYFPNYYKRKMNAAYMAGFKPNKKTGKFSNAVKDILIGEDEGVNKAIIRYVMLFYDNDYLMLILMRELLGSQSAELMKMKNSKALTRANIQAIQDMRKEVDTLVEKVFGGSESRQLEQELYKALEVEKEALHPDYIARMISNGEIDEVFKGNVEVDG